MSTQTATKAELKQELAAYQERAKRFSNKLPTNELADLGKAVAEVMEAIKDGDHDNAQDALKDLGGIINGHEETVSRNANVVPLRPATAPFGAIEGTRWLTTDERKELAVPKDPIIATPDWTVIPYKYTTCLYGAPGIGKSWIADWAGLMAAQLGEGRHVPLLHDEGNLLGIAGLQDRFEDLTRNPAWDEMRPIAVDLFNEHEFYEQRNLAIEWLLNAKNPDHSYVVIDSITFAGGALNDAEQFADWFGINIKPFQLAGIGVLIIAHESKTAPGNGPLGTTASTAAWHLELRAHCKDGQVPWTPDNSGELTLTNGKDRVGVTGKAKGEDVAIIRGTHKDGLLNLSCDHPGTQTEQVLAAKRSTKDDPAQIILNTIREHGGSFEGKDALRKASGLGPVKCNEGIDELESQGLLEVDTPGAPKPTQYQLT